MKTWGITGTNGKTTCTWVLAKFISSAPGRKCGYITTVEVDTGARKFSSGYTTPPLAALKEIYAEMEAAGCTDCAMEVSSHAIVQNRVGFGETTRFSGGGFTNLTEDHLDYHKTMEEYFRAKAKFAERLAEGVAAGPAAGRKDFPPFAVCLDGACGERMMEFAGSLPLNVLPVSEKRSPYDLSQLKLPGAFNRSNVLLAAALAEAAGVPRETIQSCIPLLAPRWGRMEKIENPFVAGEVYVDYAHTPDALEKALDALRETVRGDIIAVFGAGGDRDRAKRPLMGAACAARADILYITSDNPRSEDPEEIAAQVAAGALEHPASRCRRITVETDRLAAINAALAAAKPGDAVLIAGKGHETTQETAGVKRHFDDREAVRAWRPAPESAAERPQAT